MTRGTGHARATGQKLPGREKRKKKGRCAMEGRVRITRSRFHHFLGQHQRFHSQPSHCQWVKTHLVDRALISISGRDSAGFLQGLTTNDVLNTQSTSIPIPSANYTAFLSPKGRILLDCLLYQDNSTENRTGEPAFLLDHHSSQSVLLWKWLSRFVLRSQVKLEFRKDSQLWAFWNTSLGRQTIEDVPKPLLESLLQSSSTFKDLRGNGLLGYRMIIQPPSPHRSPESLPVDDYHLQSYALHQLLNASLPCSLSPPYSVTLPFEANLDHHRAIDFRKGCYVGQELTARTYHTGVIRKRVVPVSISNCPEMISGPPNSIPNSVTVEEESAEWFDGLELFLPSEHPLSYSADGAGKKRKPVGKLVGPVLRTAEAIYGLSLLRVDHLAFSSSLWPVLVTQPPEPISSPICSIEQGRQGQRNRGDRSRWNLKPLTSLLWWLSPNSK